MASSFNIQILSCIYLLQFAMGLVFEVVGPTIDELESSTNSTSDAISLVFSLRSTGYVLGSIVGGGIFHFFVPLISLSIAVFISSLTISAIGFISNLHLLYAIFAVNGLATGIIDVGTSVWILRLFSDKSGPYMMAFYTSFSFGTIIAPLYTGPFLQNSPTLESVSKLHVPYLITGLFTFLALVGLLLILVQQYRLESNRRNFFARRTIKQDPLTTASNALSNDRRRQTVSSSEKTLVIIGVLLIMFYSGMEIILSEFMVPMLTRSKIGISKQVATHIQSSTNTAKTIGKVIFIGITAFILPYRLLLLDSLLVIFSTTMLIIYFSSSLTALWIFSIALGLGTSSLYPSIYPFIESYVKIDYFKGSFFTCASGLTAIIYPVFIGTYLTTTPNLVLYLHLATMIVTLFLIILINIIGSRYLLTQSNYPTSANLREDVDDHHSNEVAEI